MELYKVLDFDSNLYTPVRFGDVVSLRAGNFFHSMPCFGHTQKSLISSSSHSPRMWSESAIASSSATNLHKMHKRGQTEQMPFRSNPLWQYWQSSVNKSPRWSRLRVPFSECSSDPTGWYLYLPFSMRDRPGHVGCNSQRPSSVLWRCSHSSYNRRWV